MIKLTSRYTIKKAEKDKIYNPDGSLAYEVPIDNRLFEIWDNQKDKAFIYISCVDFPELDWHVEPYCDEYYTVFIPKMLEEKIIEGTNYVWCMAIDRACQEIARNIGNRDLVFHPDTSLNEYLDIAYYGYLDLMIQIVGKENTLDFYEKTYSLALIEEDGTTQDKGIQALGKIKAYITNYGENKFN